MLSTHLNAVFSSLFYILQNSLWLWGVWNCLDADVKYLLYFSFLQVGWWALWSCSAVPVDLLSQLARDFEILCVCRTWEFYKDPGDFWQASLMAQRLSWNMSLQVKQYHPNKLARIWHLRRLCSCNLNCSSPSYDLNGVTTLIKILSTRNIFRKKGNSTKKGSSHNCWNDSSGRIWFT